MVKSGLMQVAEPGHQAEDRIEAEAVGRAGNAVGGIEQRGSMPERRDALLLSADVIEAESVRPIRIGSWLMTVAADLSGLSQARFIRSEADRLEPPAQQYGADREAGADGRQQDQIALASAVPARRASFSDQRNRAAVVLP